MSTKPGVTTWPVASMVSAASPSTPPPRRTSTMTPSFTATSPSKRSAPVPSTIVPPRITRSCTTHPLRSSPDSVSHGQLAEGGQHVLHGESEQPGVGLVGQRLAPPARPEGHVAARGRRAPLGRRRGPEEDDGGAAEGGGQV